MRTCAAMLLSLLVAASAEAAYSHIESAARQFVGNLERGRFEEASQNFTDDLKAVLPLKTLQQIREKIDGQLGTYLTIVEAKQKVEDGFRVIDLMARYEKGSAAFHVTFDEKDRIAAVGFDPAKVVALKRDPTLEAKAREMLADFNAGRYVQASKDFDPKLRTELPIDELRKLTAQMAEAYGGFRSISDVRYSTDDRYRVIELVALYDRMNVIVRVSFDTEGRIAGLRFAPGQ